MGKAHTSEDILLRDVILSFPQLEKASKFKQDNPDEVAKFSAAFLLDPSNPEHAKTIAKIKSESARIAKLEFDGEIPKSMSDAKNRCWGTDADLDKVYEGYAGMFFVKGKSPTPVPIVGRVKTATDPRTGKPAFALLTPQSPEWPRAGNKVNAKISVWCQNSHGRKAINGNLLTIQFVEPGTPIGNKSANPDEHFDGYEDATGGADPFGGEAGDEFS